MRHTAVRLTTTEAYGRARGAVGADGTGGQLFAASDTHMPAGLAADGRPIGQYVALSDAHAPSGRADRQTVPL